MSITKERLEQMHKADLKRQLMGIGSMHPSWLDANALEKLMSESPLTRPAKSRREWLEQVRQKHPDRFSDETWDRMIAEASDTEMI